VSSTSEGNCRTHCVPQEEEAGGRSEQAQQERSRTHRRTEGGGVRQLKLGDGQYCFPRTAADGYSRLLLACQALTSTKLVEARPILERLFRESGAPPGASAPITPSAAGHQAGPRST
jgi:hypothetical protein